MSFIYKSPSGKILSVRVDDPLDPVQLEMLKDEKDLQITLHSWSRPVLRSMESLMPRIGGMSIGTEGKIPKGFWGDIQHLKYIRIGYGVRITNEDFGDFTNLITLSVDSDDVSKEMIYSSKSCRSLKIDEAKSLKGFEVEMMPNLTHLSINAVKYGNLPLSWGWDQLKSFGLSNYRGNDFRLIPFSSSLEMVKLGNVKISWEEDFPTYPKLKILNLRNCGKLPKFFSLAESKNLEEVLFESKSSIEGIESLEGSSCLKGLVISGCYFENKNLSWLCNCKNLEHLMYYDSKEYTLSRLQIFESLGLFDNGTNRPPRRGIDLSIFQEKKWWDLDTNKLSPRANQ